MGLTIARRLISNTSTAPSTTDVNNRSFLPSTTSEPYFSSGNPANFDFVPTMNFDDFQSSITDPNWTSPLLSEFPAESAGRPLPKEDEPNMARNNGFASTRAGVLKQEEGEADVLGRTASLRRRLSGAPGARQAPGQTSTNVGHVPSSASQPNLSVRTKRQSTMPQGLPAAAPSYTPAVAGNRAPRKSIGPGLLTTMMDGARKNNGQPTPTTASDPTLKPALARTSSLKTARRTTVQPTAASAGAELPRISTLTASRANKVKSLQPPPREQQQQQHDPNTPNNGRPVSKGNPSNRSHTPTSSGGNNKRQSTISGRASGLGARTISPTDARRLKRMSMMQAPPMPTHLPTSSKGPPTPQDDVPSAFAAAIAAARPELPRLTQPSPSLIPKRKTSSATPSSARASPESRIGFGMGSYGGGVSLSAKSSYQSLLNANNSSNAGSRLPTPKPRNVHSSSAQYGETMDEELVPPVPAIPKAYESPKFEHEQPFFSASASLKSSHSPFTHATEPTAAANLGEFDFERSLLPPLAGIGQTPRSSIDVASGSDTPRKRSGELPRHHKRTNTAGTNGTALKASRAQPEATGRKNNSLQPLRLPPLNLMPINNPSSDAKATAGLPRPSQELDSREQYSSVQTPEPHGKRSMAKTPSTPMTASKATFFRRQDEAYQTKAALRTSSSHHALRHASMQMDDDGMGATRFFDSSDEAEMSAGVPIPRAMQRAAITPFASGSLPKSESEFGARSLRGRPSGEYSQELYRDEYDLGVAAYAEGLQLQSARPRGQRAKTSGVFTLGSAKQQQQKEDMDLDGFSPVVEPQQQPKEKDKKESTGSGLRRKLSLGWRRSSSKAASHAENNKASPQQQQDGSSASEKEKGSSSASGKLQKRSSEMPPPRLPASASAQWGAGEVPSLPRPSLESMQSRRKSTLQMQQVNGGSHAGLDGAEVPMTTSVATGGVKTRALHSEQPQPVNTTTNNRSSSWAAFTASTNGSTRPTSKAAPNGFAPKHKLTASTLSAIVKDKDDLAADDEMRRLSQKRRDVDAAARESDSLRARAMARSPMSPERVLHDRTCALNIFERGEIVEYEKEGIFFTGGKGARKIIGSLAPSPTGGAVGEAGKAGNYGYDDERGDYNIVLGDHLAYRYEVVDVLGKGSFGQVVRCVDHKEGGVVAVKIIRNKKRFHQQALVEVGILGRLREWVC